MNSGTASIKILAHATSTPVSDSPVCGSGSAGTMQGLGNDRAGKTAPQVAIPAGMNNNNNAIQA